MIMDEVYDVTIIGAGPAGLTAGLYCAQAGLRVVALEKETLGGQIMNIEKIENYPGFADGVSGPQLGQEMTMQAMNYGVEIKLAEVVGLELGAENKRVKTANGDYVSPAVIIAGGGEPLRLRVPGEEEFRENGVAYCGMCEGGQFKDMAVAVAGGGDSGVTEALYLANLASKVIIVEMMPELNAKSLLQNRVRQNQKVEIMCHSKVQAIVGDSQVRAIELLDTETNTVTTVALDGVLVHIGWVPQTKYLENVVPLDSEGHVMVKETMETELPGVFAAGDIRHGSLRQVASAIGDGTATALAAQRYLREGKS